MDNLYTRMAALVVTGFAAAWALFKNRLPATEGFEEDVHQSYLALPPLPPADSWKLSQEVYDYALGHPGTVVLSKDEPRLLLLKSFLSPSETQHLIQANRARLERSQVLSGKADKVRTSRGAWADNHDPLVQEVKERIHRAIGIPTSFGEDIYVLNYQRGQRYTKHNDHCMDTGDVATPACKKLLSQGGGPTCGPGSGGPTCGDRLATFIVYLKSPDLGGRTVFPEAAATKAALGTLPAVQAAHDGIEWYCKDAAVLGAAPQAGDAILFWNYTPGTGPGTGSFLDGSAKPQARKVYEAMHSGCPVLQGEKWITTRWIRSAPFNA